MSGEQEACAACGGVDICAENCPETYPDAWCQEQDERDAALAHPQDESGEPHE